MAYFPESCIHRLYIKAIDWLHSKIKMIKQVLVFTVSVKYIKDIHLFQREFKAQMDDIKIIHIEAKGDQIFFKFQGGYYCYDQINLFFGQHNIDACFSDRLLIREMVKTT